MFLTLMRLEPRAASVQRDLRDPQALHRTVMRGFPNVIDLEVGARAHYNVLHRLEFQRRTGQIMLYVQSGVAPNWSDLPPDYLVDDGMPNPTVKPVADAFDNLGVDRSLRFRLRANPTRKVATKSGPDGKRRHGRRVPLSGVDAQVEWLVRKADDHGFELIQVVVAATGSTELVSSRSAGLTFQGVLFEGRLLVRDPDRLRSALVQGIGPGKAYGFGLLSIGPD